MAKESDGKAGVWTSQAVDAVTNLSEPKSVRKAIKALDKEAKSIEKSEKKATKKAAKKAAKDAKNAVEHGDEPPELPDSPTKGSSRTPDEPRVTPKKARNLVHVAQVVIPAALPVLTPFAVRAATAVREFLDKQQARRLGTDVDTLSEFSGHGAALHVRIAGLSDNLIELRTSENPAARGFADEASGSLRQLSAAVRAAETMPGSRRKEAHRAVSAELDELEAKLLHHLGV